MSNPGELRALYKDYGNEARRALARSGLWLAVPVYLLFLVTDLIFTPDVSHVTIPARFFIGGTSLLILEIQFARQRRAGELEATCAGAVVFGYVVWLVPTLQTANAEAFSYYAAFGAIFMMGVNLFFSLEFALALASSGLIFVIFLLSLAEFHYSPAYCLAFTTFYLCCFVFTSYVNWKLNKERFNVFLNAREAELQQRQATERGEALLRLSITDSLTGMENRRAADIRLKQFWERWREDGVAFAVLLVDVDFFKKFNDYYGHQEGDHCLVTVANALSDIVAPLGATVGRYGGEEFIVILDLERGSDALALAEAICQGIEALDIVHAQRLDGFRHVTVSVGATVTRDAAGTKLENVINEADRALYSAKASGRNCARIFDPNELPGGDASETIAAILKIAIQQNLVSLVYQPIQYLDTGEIGAYEALMRLQLLDGSSSSPAIFIPIAERTGAIIELGYWAIRRACCELLSRDIVETVSVNVSPIQLRAPGFAAQVAAILAETGVSGHRIAFEITEGVDMEIRPDVLDSVQDLKRLGIKFWLDDFGTGFAGLSWLRLMDFETVKIDKSFLHDAANNEGAKILLEDIIGLVRNRGHRILVEGIENEEQLDLVKSFGIDAVQGYHIGRPAPPLKHPIAVRHAGHRRWQASA
ncbi:MULTISPECIES: putative bifunctional diguanylate cyclase/phosphodiesterase [unclassified Rhizobium]|uniref:putative bifunctional diguanylate cyclase/phosphodiesterase n=1 Tax=unclassified Rhizobium TaxID=2613769 RepID=UPI001FEF7958|nr:MULTISPECIES: bifunctional diguanylate cyclase/phosphodiesterase [unclassified Rhizobium]